jgi:hypothetical protein
MSFLHSDGREGLAQAQLTIKMHIAPRAHLVAARLHPATPEVLSWRYDVRFLAIGLVMASVVASGACQKAGSTTEAEPAAAAVGAAPAPAAPEPKMVTVPAGTTLTVVLETPVGSDTSHVEQAVSAHLAKAVLVDGVTTLPDGSAVGGVVTDAARSGKVKGRAHIALRFNSITPVGAERYQMRTATVARTAADTKDRDTAEIAAPAVGGAIVGGLIGGGKGAAIGAATGGGAGTAVVLSTRGKEVSIGRGATLTLHLTEPLSVKVGG